MPLTVHLLGSGSSYNTGRRLTTALAIEADSDVVVVDCGSNTARALAAAGLPLDRVQGLILTHEHPDHTVSFPLFMQQLWLAGRNRALPVHGPAPALDVARRLWGQYDTSGWDDLFDVTYHDVALEAGAALDMSVSVQIVAAPTQHSVPGIGLRMATPDGSVFAYSSDTAPAPAIVDLAHNADLLIHEATGEHSGHSSGADAGRVASEANASRLVLVHLPGTAAHAEHVATEARKYFDGPVTAGRDGATYHVEPVSSRR